MLWISFPDFGKFIVFSIIKTFASVCASENSNGCFQESKATSEPLAPRAAVVEVMKSCCTVMSSPSLPLRVPQRQYMEHVLLLSELLQSAESEQGLKPVGMDGTGGEAQISREAMGTR
ncbi:hypothetical protein Nmel_014081 [Mimus melanotis]